MARAQVAVTEEIYQSSLKDTLEKEDNDCENLVYMYKYVGDRASKCQTFKEFVNCADGQFLRNLKTNIADLGKVERPIVVIGETSAGKSSFLNLLIGDTVLPELTGPLTNHVCRIKQGTQLSASFSYDDGKNQHTIKSITGVSYDAMRKTLKQWMQAGDPRTNKPGMFIDVFVPCSLLEGNLYLVDTPGFGDNDKDTELLLSYLPKAVGIVFILNTTVSYGMGKDRGSFILDRLKKLGKKVPSFDRSKVLFIANKWDQVTEKEERESHLKTTFERIKKHWDDLQKDQLLPLSVHRVRAVKEQNGCHRNDDKEFLDSYSEIYRKLTDIVKHCAGSRSPVHKPRLVNLYTKFQTRMQDVFAFYYLSEKDQKKMIARITTSVTKLESTSQEAEREIGLLATEFEKDLATRVHRYLNDTNNRQEIFPWTQGNMPDGDDLAKIKSNAEILIVDFINTAISKRVSQSSALKDKVQHKVNVMTSKMKTQEKNIESLLEKADRETWSRSKGTGFKAGVHTDRIQIPTLSGLQVEFDDDDKTAMAVIAVTAPVWVPIVIAGSVTVLPVYLFAKFTSKVYKRRQYMQNRHRYLDKWADKIIQERFTITDLLGHIRSDARDDIKNERARVACCINKYEKVLQEL